MYARDLGERRLTFDFGEGLLQNNLLLVDRETQSVWSQLQGRAVSGPLQGEPLRSLPALQTTWKHWRERHPDTEVMILPDREGRPYYYRNVIPGQPVPRSREHDTSQLGLGLVLEGEAIFFPFRELQRSPLPVRVNLGGQAVLVHYRKDALSAWAEDLQGRLLPGILVYRSNWMDFFPSSRLFQAEP